MAHRLHMTGMDLSTGKQSRTSNVTTFFNKTTKRYEITVMNVTYNRLQYTAVAIVSGYNNKIWIINTDDSPNGKLLVDLRHVNALSSVTLGVLRYSA